MVGLAVGAGEGALVCYGLFSLHGVILFLVQLFTLEMVFESCGVYFKLKLIFIYCFKGPVNRLKTDFSDYLRQVNITPPACARNAGWPVFKLPDASMFVWVAGFLSVGGWASFSQSWELYSCQPASVCIRVLRHQFHCF